MTRQAILSALALTGMMVGMLAAGPASHPAQQAAAAEKDQTGSANALAVDPAEASETARLLAVLLDCGRVVVGKAQAAINNPRLGDKNFSASVFAALLRKEFQVRTGYDLNDLPAAPMPDSAKPLLQRLTMAMKGVVQEHQSLINQKGIGFKGFIPATFATESAQRFSQRASVTIRQIGPPGIAPRNPGNKPDAEEEQAMRAMQKSHPRVGDHVVEQLPRAGELRVMLPLFYSKPCLSCHGKPKGEIDLSGYPKEGFKEGDLGGAISVTLMTQNPSGER
jgi:hypothetical protein